MTSTASPSNGHTHSPADTAPSTAPNAPKLTKMAKLKKTVNERQQQKQERQMEDGGASAESATTRFMGLNDNCNNSNRRHSLPVVVVEEEADDVGMGLRSMSGDLPCSYTARCGSASAKSSMSSIYVSKTSLPPLTEEREEQVEGTGTATKPTTSGRKLIRQRHSTSDTSVTVTSTTITPDPYKDDDDVI